MGRRHLTHFFYFSLFPGRKSCAEDRNVNIAREPIILHCQNFSVLKYLLLAPGYIGRKFVGRKFCVSWNIQWDPTPAHECSLLVKYALSAGATVSGECQVDRHGEENDESIGNGRKLLLLQINLLVGENVAHKPASVCVCLPFSSSRRDRREVYSFRSRRQIEELVIASHFRFSSMTLPRVSHSNWQANDGRMNFKSLNSNFKSYWIRFDTHYRAKTRLTWSLLFYHYLHSTHHRHKRL